MQASVVIPVWNGAAVIAECLSALYTHCGSDLLEVICVDNASADASAQIISAKFPQARLLPQPVNLGFAGGVNVGLEAAGGELLILLNQDCFVLPGWLEALAEACQAYPQFGIFGCTIYEFDGKVNHTGARLRRPEAVSVHLTDLGDGKVRRAEFVTGAALALRRQTWETVGRFDEGFYPAYYEDSDYCLRARQQAIETAWAPQARVRHLFSSREWQADPYKHTANSHAMRYRFVSKHFSVDEIASFFLAEEAALADMRYMDHLLGRVVAARQTLRSLPDILERRRQDLGDPLANVGRSLLQTGLVNILRQAFQQAEALVMQAPIPAASLLAATEPAPPGSADGEPTESPEPALAERLAKWPVLHEDPELNAGWAATARQLEELRRREDQLLLGIFFRSPYDNRTEPRLAQVARLLFRRLPSILAGRERNLLAQLNAVQVARANLIEQRLEQAAHAARLSREELYQHLVGVQQLLWPMYLQDEQMKQQLQQTAAELERQQQEIHLLKERLKLLELLEMYDYR